RRLSDAGSIRPQLGDGGVRLQKDYDNESASSDEESSDEPDTDHESSRGRGRARVGNAVGITQDSDDDEPSPPLNADPTITITPPSTDQPSSASAYSSRKPDVHPSTAFDFAASTTSTPVHSDDEEHLSDLRRAQRLSLNISPIHSTPSAHRVIRQIIRGDYLYFQRQAEEGRRRQRVYLVATDLSSEAEYALEWTIGTVLRDGDTLLAVYAVDEESGTGGVSEGVEIGHGADVVKDTATIVRSMTAESMTPATLPRDSSTARMAFSERKDMSKAEQDRFRAAEDISQRCVKLLRKTRLQVRVVVEVFHCKSPRHMITEVIDFLSPTLTILGSRGRSQLKGVLLGSFSNYLVTKSSVPVMVARKRLRKHSKQRLHKDGLPVAQAGDGRMRYIRMSNVLEAPGTKPRARGLAGAKID
ncbi:adenine nucleotide alpha hydrolases-like protein, partial [Aureobasidium melanogenum]